MASLSSSLQHMSPRSTTKVQELYEMVLGVGLPKIGAIDYCLTSSLFVRGTSRIDVTRTERKQSGLTIFV